MSDARRVIGAIAAMRLPRPMRVLCLSVHQERVLETAEMRRLLDGRVDLVRGLGSIAGACPLHDIYQAMRLAERHAVTLLVDERMMSVPLIVPRDGPVSLLDAMRQGADIHAVQTPIEAVAAAREQPQREMVLFAAGFETLLAPLAGMVIDGLPENLSILLCGRRAEPLVEHLLSTDSSAFDALLLPGNRCALTGTEYWDHLSGTYRKPAVVAGYWMENIVGALHALLHQFVAGSARVENHYRALAHPGGDMLARDQLDRVFELVAGIWRGIGPIDAGGFRLRNTYRDINADHRFPDYRGELLRGPAFQPAGC